MLKPLVVVCLIQLSLPLACHGTDWYEVQGFPDNGARVYVDDSSVKVDHDTVVSGWVRFEYPQPREIDGRKMAAQNSLRMVNCEDRRYWITEAWAYPADHGEPVQLYSSFQEWQLAAPESEAQVALDALCYETKSLFGILWDKAGQGLSRVRRNVQQMGQ